MACSVKTLTQTKHPEILGGGPSPWCTGEGAKEQSKNSLDHLLVQCHIHIKIKPFRALSTHQPPSQGETSILNQCAKKKAQYRVPFMT